MSFGPANFIYVPSKRRLNIKHMTPFRFLDLPVEIQSLVLYHCMRPTLLVTSKKQEYRIRLPTAVLQVSRAIYNAATPLLINDSPISLEWEHERYRDVWISTLQRLKALRYKPSLGNETDQVHHSLTLTDESPNLANLQHIYLDYDWPHIIEISFGTQQYATMPMDTVDLAYEAMAQKIATVPQWNSRNMALEDGHSRWHGSISDMIPRGDHCSISTRTIYLARLEWGSSNLPELSHYSIGDMSAAADLRFEVIQDYDNNDSRKRWKIRHISQPQRTDTYINMALYQSGIAGTPALASKDAEYPLIIENCLVALQRLIPQCFKVEHPQ